MQSVRQVHDADDSLPPFYRDERAYADAVEGRTRQTRQHRGLPVCRWRYAKGQGTDSVGESSAVASPAPASTIDLPQISPERETIALVSYPRSGNSMLRGMLETLYGVFTGSDTRPDRTLSRALRDQFGMAGEGVVDPSLVRIVKSHWPERRGWKPVRAHRAILVVRNPFDAIDSYFNMCLTNTHDLSLAEENYSRFKTLWENMMCEEAKLWDKFHRWWISRPIPLIVVRYEDLRNNPAETLSFIADWIERGGNPAYYSAPQSTPKVRESTNNGKGIAGSVTAAVEDAVIAAASRVACSSARSEGALEYDQATSPGAEGRPTTQSDSQCGASNVGGLRGTPYVPRVGGIGKALRRFTKPGLLEEMCAAAGSSLTGFGYHPKVNGFPEKIRRPANQRCVRPGSLFHRIAGDDENSNIRGSCQRSACEDASIPTVTLNHSKTPELREEGDRFGRYMTTFRKLHTDGDTKPLPVKFGTPYRVAPKSSVSSLPSPPPVENERPFPPFSVKLVAEFLTARDLTEAAPTDIAFAEAFTDNKIWQIRCEKDLSVSRPTSRQYESGFFRSLYLAVVEERIMEQNCVAMGH